MAEIKIENKEELYAEKRIVSCRLNLREAPDKSAKVIRVMLPGEEIDVLDYMGDWAQLEEGFCMVKFLD